MVQLFGLFPISASWEELNTDTPGKQESQTQNLEPKRLAAKKKKKSKSRPQKAKEEDRSLTFMQWMVIIFISAYAAIQIAIPTRHIWGTNKHRPQWNSAVQYFGWRMMMVGNSQFFHLLVLISIDIFFRKNSRIADQPPGIKPNYAHCTPK